MHLIAIGATAAATIFAGAAHAQESHWLSFSKAEFRIVNHDFKVEVDPASRDGHHAWMAKRVEQGRKEPEQSTWTDSDTCPAMMPAFAKLQSIEPFTIVPPGLPGDHKAPVIVDGAVFEIRSQQGYWAHAHQNGEITLSGNYGTPVADWVEETMKVLAPCWSKKRRGA